jgi:hypothetical protein
LRRLLKDCFEFAACEIAECYEIITEATPGNFLLVEN